MSGTCIAADNLSVVTHLALVNLTLVLSGRPTSYLRHLCWPNFLDPLSLGVWRGYYSLGKKSVCVFLM